MCIILEKVLAFPFFISSLETRTSSTAVELLWLSILLLEEDAQLEPSIHDSKGRLSQDVAIHGVLVILRTGDWQNMVSITDSPIDGGSTK